MARFSEKAVVITGGSSGIGLATALRIAQEGGRVLVSGKNRDKLAAVRSAHPEIEVVENDAADLAAAEALAAEARRLFGTIDGAFLNAGLGTPAMLGGIRPDMFRSLIDLNVGGPLFGIQALAPMMNPGGAFLITASTAAHRGYAGASIYSAAKGAVRAMARSLARELAPKDVRVNTISPGGTRTDFFNRLGLPDEQVQAVEHQIEAGNPLRRMASAQEIAGVAAFLLSVEAAYVTGADYAVDGGEAQL